MITIDGISYNVNWVQGLQQSADILNGEGTGRLQGTGEMYLEYVGTFFNHKGTLVKDSKCTEEEWDNLFRVLANPINDHTVSFPFGANQELTQEIYISSIVRTLKLIKETNKNKWANVYEVSFVAKRAGWLPNGAIEGLI